MSADDVASVSARVHPLVLELMDRPNPRVGLEGKFSHQHSMAVGLIDGGAFPAQYTDERVLDPAVAALRDKIRATVDPAIAEDACEVTVTLRDGRALTESVDPRDGRAGEPDV